MVALLSSATFSDGRDGFGDGSGFVWPFKESECWADIFWEAERCQLMRWWNVEAFK